jgi:hypothetical protein
MVTRAINKCKGCGAFVAVMQKTTVTVHKIDGMGPTEELPRLDADIIAEDTEKFIESLPQRTCFECGQKFHSENPCMLKGEIVCDDCFLEDCNKNFEKHKGTHPDPERIHCKECGLLYPEDEYCHEYGMCKECAEHSDFKELAGRVQNTKPEYVPLPDSRTVSYCIDGDIIKLQYKGNDCNAYASDVIWDIVDSPKPDWMSRIDEILADEKNRVQKASALNQLCKAVGKGTVKIPGSDE